MALQNPPTWMQTTPGDIGYSAADDRLVINSIITTSGITSSTSFGVTQTGTPSLDVNVAAGAAFIVGTDATFQGIYHVVNDGTAPVTLLPGSSTNPRLDLIILTIKDSQYGGVLNEAQLTYVLGTPAGSPSAPALPASSIALATVRVNQNATSVNSSNITDLRSAARFNDFMSPVPTGAFMAFGGTSGFIPPGYLWCGGQAVSRTTYARLFSVIGTHYGAGDGTTTFNLPNGQGRMPFGYDGTAVFGSVGGSKTHTLTVAEMPPHTHTQQPHAHGYMRNAGNAQFSVAGGTGWDLDALSTTSATTAVNDNTGGGLPHNNMPPHIVMNWMIKT